MILYEDQKTVEEPIDRTPTKEQVTAMKDFVDKLVDGKPMDYNELLSPVEKEFPSVFTDSEKVAIFEEMNTVKKAGFDPVSATLEEIIN